MEPREIEREGERERERDRCARARGQRSLFNLFRRIGDGTLINIIYDVNSATRYYFRDRRNDIITPRDPAQFLPMLMSMNIHGETGEKRIVVLARWLWISAI